MKPRNYCEICKKLISAAEFENFDLTICTKEGFVHTKCLETEYKGFIEFDESDENYDKISFA